MSKSKPAPDITTYFLFWFVVVVLACGEGYTKWFSFFSLNFAYEIIHGGTWETIVVARGQTKPASCMTHAITLFYCTSTHYCIFSKKAFFLSLYCFDFSFFIFIIHKFMCYVIKIIVIESPVKIIWFQKLGTMNIIFLFGDTFKVSIM